MSKYATEPADLPSYIKASFFTSRDQDLPIYGPGGNHLMPATSQFVDKLLGNDGAFRYLSDYVDPDQANDYHLQVTDVAMEQIQTFQLSDQLELEAVAVHHGPIPALAWRISAAGCAISFSGDMSNRTGTVLELAKNSDLLVAHNAVPEGARGIARNLHMPPSEIGKIARDAKVKRLLLSHRMRRSLGRESETETSIRQYYQGTIEFAGDLDRYSLP